MQNGFNYENHIIQKHKIETFLCPQIKIQPLSQLKCKCF